MAPNTPASTAARSASPMFSAIAAEMTGDSAFFDQAHNATDGTSQHSPASAAMISGLACGTFVLVLLACGLCWFIRNRNTPRCCSHRTTRRSTRGIHMSNHIKSVDTTPSSQASEWEVLREYRPPPPMASTTRTRTRSESQNWTRHDLRRQDSVATAATLRRDGRNVGLGVGIRGVREGENIRYTCLKPDPVSATTAADQTRTGSAQRWVQGQQRGTVARAAPPIEAPAHATPQPQTQFHAKGHPDLDRSLPASPSISSMPMPITPATEFTTSPTSTSTSEVQTPQDYYRQQEPAYTPSIYQPYPPTSLPRARQSRTAPGHSAAAYSSPYAATATSHSTITSLPSSPPPLPTAYNTTTYTPTSRNTNNTYTPAPGPPSLPQPYSTVSLGSTAEIYRSPNLNLNFNNDLYRGLSTRNSPQKTNASPPKQGANVEGEAKREKPPWDYLSAEEARGGGWKNRDSTGAVSGWETIGEEEEGVGEGK